MSGDNVVKYEKYRAAAIQFDPTLGEVEKNVSTLLKMCEEAAANGAKLIVTPEMATTGYCWYDRQEVTPVVEPIPGPTTNRFAELAARHDVYIVVGMAEVDPNTGIYYNSSALVGPSGVIGVYRKTHSFISETTWAKDGDLGIPVWETEIGNLSMLICMDLDHMEAGRVAGLNGADVICFPTNWLSEKGPASYWMTQAFDNGLYVIAADRSGLERGVQFTGGSGIINPDGSIQSYVDSGDGIVYGEIDLNLARSKSLYPGSTENKMADRRPDQYYDVMLNTYLFPPREFHGLYGRRRLPEGGQSPVAVAQIRPVAGDVAGNLDKMESYARQAKQDAGSLPGLIVFPELSAAGIISSRDRANRLAEEAPGPITARVIRLAAEIGKYVVFGMVEREGAALYNTAVLAGPDGIVGKYRKLHLSASDREWATAGDLGLPTFDLPLGRVGLLIGYDLMFPEPTRCLSLWGADLICVPAALEGPEPIGLGATAVPHPDPIFKGDDPLHWCLWKDRAGKNEVYVAVANIPASGAGGDYIGTSGVFGPSYYAFPRQQVVAPREGETLLTLEIETGNVTGKGKPNPSRVKELFTMRQPYWYDIIVEKEPPVVRTLRKPVETASRHTI